jgi:hypothetical protein
MPTYFGNDWVFNHLSFLKNSRFPVSRACQSF